MRIAVLSDIHGNLLALEAVVEDMKRFAPDQVWCGGDIAWAGPWPNECIAYVRDAGWPTVKGNTDVWITGEPRNVDAQERDRFREIASLHQISRDDENWLINLPLGHTGPGSMLLVHGTPESPFDAPMPDAPPGEFEPYAGHAQLVLYGHIHHTLTRRLIDGTLVANPGSVGLPMDDETASYMVIDQGGSDFTLRVRRVRYERERALEQARRVGDEARQMFVQLMGEA